MDYAICPSCKTIFLLDFYPDDECPSCEEDVLVSWEEYQERFSSSFLEAFT